MRAWRVCKSKFEAIAFSGIGAADYPGRWNLLGEKVVYCADSRSLACLEVLAHVSRKRTLSRAKFIAIPVDLPDALIFRPSRLPQGWGAIPNTEVSQRAGSRFSRAHAVVRLPSVVVRGEFVIVLNPLHPDFSKVSIGKPEPLVFDARVLSGPEKPSSSP